MPTDPSAPPLPRGRIFGYRWWKFAIVSPFLLVVVVAGFMAMIVGEAVEELVLKLDRWCQQ